MQPDTQKLFDQLLGPCSPLTAASKDGPAGSVSFQNDLENTAAGGIGFTAQSRPARAPFGDLVSVRRCLGIFFFCISQADIRNTVL